MADDVAILSAPAAPRRRGRDPQAPRDLSLPAGSVRAGDPEDKPRRIGERNMPLAVAAHVAELNERTLRQWIARGVVPDGVGARNASGDWRFSKADAVFLAAMASLSRLDMPLADAAGIARIVERYASGYCDRLGNGEPERRSLLLSREPGTGILLACWADGDPSSPMRLSPQINEHTRAGLARPTIVVPATAIVVAVLLKDVDALEVAFDAPEPEEG